MKLIENLKSRIGLLENRVNELENPPKYKYGDTVIYVDTNDYYMSIEYALTHGEKCTIIENVKILGVVKKEHRPIYCGTSRLYWVDTGTELMQEYECSLITKEQYKSWKSQN